LCNRGAEGVELKVVREAPPAVDLDDREPLPVHGFKGVVAGDVDLAEIEPELRLEGPELLERPLAEVAALRVVDDDVGGYG
jgi:hypothetical protein